MKSKTKQIFLLIFLIILLFTINYHFLDNVLSDFLDESRMTFVEQIIDGDTIVIENNTHVRLLGINSPEKGEPYFEEAKKFLENLTSNKTVVLEFGKEKRDKYGRTLGYVFLNNENINLKMVKEGYANFYFPSGKDPYYNEFVDAWKECLDKEKNLCEKSKDKCVKCIELKELNVEKQEIILYNRCNFDCNLTGWNIKDEGRKKFIFPNFILEKNKEIKIIVGDYIDSKNVLYWKNEKYVWTKTGDTLFLKDDEGKLVLWESY